MKSGNRSRRHIVASALTAGALAVSLASCGLIQKDPPAGGRTDTVAVTKAVEFDLSGSALSTDLYAAAENTALQQAKDLQPGEALVVDGFNSDVTVACTPVTVSMAKQNNPQQETELRRNIVANFPPTFRRYTDCIAKHASAGRSEIFGAISDFFDRYPEVTDIEVVTDGCENVAVANLCSPYHLQSPGYADKVVNALPNSLIPHLDRSVRIDYTGIGRGSGLPAAAVRGLRAVWAAWTAKTRATYSFDAT